MSLARHLARVGKPVRYAVHPAVRNFLALATGAGNAFGLHQEARPEIDAHLGRDAPDFHAALDLLHQEHDPVGLAAGDMYSDITGRQRSGGLPTNPSHLDHLLYHLSVLHNTLGGEGYLAHPVEHTFRPERLTAPDTLDLVRHMANNRELRPNQNHTLLGSMQYTGDRRRSARDVPRTVRDMIRDLIPGVSQGQPLAVARTQQAGRRGGILTAGIAEDSQKILSRLLDHLDSTRNR